MAGILTKFMRDELGYGTMANNDKDDKTYWVLIITCGTN